MQPVFLEDELIVDKGIWVGQVDIQYQIVVGDIGAQQQGRHAIEAELEAREVARVAMEEAVRTIGGGAYIPVAVEHGKALAVLERSLWSG